MLVCIAVCLFGGGGVLFVCVCVCVCRNGGLK